MAFTFKITKGLDDVHAFKPICETVNHPGHYNLLQASCKHCKEQIECIDVVREMNFNSGNAIKYIWRAEHKGNRLEDLKKALWYIQDEISRVCDQIEQSNL